MFETLGRAINKLFIFSFIFYKNFVKFFLRKNFCRLSLLKWKSSAAAATFKKINSRKISLRKNFVKFFLMSQNFEMQDSQWCGVRRVNLFSRIGGIVRVTIFFRQRTGTVVVFAWIFRWSQKKKSSLQRSTVFRVIFLVFSKKKRSSLQRHTVFANFWVIFTNKQKTGTFPPTGREPGTWP